MPNKDNYADTSSTSYVDYSDTYASDINTRTFDAAWPKDVAYINGEEYITRNSSGEALSSVEQVYDYDEDEDTPRNDSYNAIRADIDDDTSLLRKTMRSAGIYSPLDMRYWTTFYRIPRLDPYNIVEGVTEYDFFTKPDINILNAGNLSDDCQKIPYFNYLWNCGYRDTVLENLDYSNSDKSCPFVRILSNRRTSNIDIPDISVDDYETAQNMYGTKVYYPKSSLQSDENSEFTVEFEDTRFLDIYNYFKAWDYFRRLKWLGLVSPSEKNIFNKILSDHISVYKFLIDNDGETIIHYSKWTGVYPKSISRSAFSEIQSSGPLKITVGFKSSGWFEDMSPNILTDFNALIVGWLTSGAIDGTQEMPIWDDEIGAVSGENVDYPYIDMPASDKLDERGYSLPLLKWGKFVEQ